MKKIVLTALVLGVAAFAQENPIATSGANNYKTVAANITKSIERMPAEKYGYKATPETMAFAEFVGHLADANFSYCSAVTGSPRPESVRKETSKEKLAAAWANAMAECTKAWSSATDKSLAANVKVGQREVPAAQQLFGNTSHSFEHYGNLVTLLRLNGMVPPSSDPR